MLTIFLPEFVPFTRREIEQDQVCTLMPQATAGKTGQAFSRRSQPQNCTTSTLLPGPCTKQLCPLQLCQKSGPGSGFSNWGRVSGSDGSNPERNATGDIDGFVSSVNGKAPALQ
jgi:hypothetical protein